MADIPRKPLPPQDYLIECISYDPVTGLMFWKDRPKSHFASDALHKWWKNLVGKPAFNSVNTSSGYLEGTLDGVRYKAHRIAFKIIYGTEPSHVDHDDRNRKNNSKLNLKGSDSEANRKNITMQCNNTSGVTGVRYDPARGKWKARLGKQELGRFDSFDAAVAARTAALSQHNYHPNHGT